MRQHSDEFDVIKLNGAITSARSDLNAVHFVQSSWWRSLFHTWKQRRDLYGAYQWLHTALNAHWKKVAFNRSKLVVAVSEQVKQEIVRLFTDRFSL